ncbi:hypothetical protein D1839_04280 [Roseburia sp. 1XD42-34]|nr:hypothetical protein [Roseburia sp. 1XD42-34]RKI80634.1 hypothetical protein D7V87_03640 [Clostridium sp. 1xD42-85]
MKSPSYWALAPGVAYSVIFHYSKATNFYTFLPSKKNFKKQPSTCETNIIFISNAVHFITIYYIPSKGE